MKKLYKDSLSLQSFQVLDMAVFIKSFKGEYLWANNFFIQKSAGFNSLNEIYRKQDYHFAWHEYSDDLKANDQLLMEGKDCVNVKERILRYDGTCVNIISKKSCLYDKEKLIGLIGFSIEMPASIIIKSLSRREYDIIYLLAQGQTDKRIGKKLSISPRTVESHINNAKIKLKVTTRAELIVKFLT